MISLQRQKVTDATLIICYNYEYYVLQQWKGMRCSKIKVRCVIDGLDGEKRPSCNESLFRLTDAPTYRQFHEELFILEEG